MQGFGFEESNNCGQVKDVVNGVNFLPESLDVFGRKVEGREKLKRKVVENTNGIKKCPEAAGLEIIESKDPYERQGNK